MSDKPDYAAMQPLFDSLHQIADAPAKPAPKPRDPIAIELNCPICDGDGTVLYEPPGRWDVRRQACPECHGWGAVAADPYADEDEDETVDLATQEAAE